jgi:hypothetical protein
MDWKNNIKGIFNDPEFSSPNDVSLEKFDRELDNIDAIIPEDIISAIDEQRWTEIVKDLWAVAYLGDEENQSRWLKAYSEEEWKAAFPNGSPEGLDPDEQRRYRELFVFRKVAQSFRNELSVPQSGFPGWVPTG